jgi:intracellular sulfur oxidation DsrE/DsrF family protein
MSLRTLPLMLVGLLGVALPARAQSTAAASAAPSAAPTAPSVGPVITSGGGVYPVANADFTIPSDVALRARFDVAESPARRDSVNPGLNSAARFLNMHAQAGIPRERVQVAVVVHGAASRDVLSDAAYRKRFGAANPNQRLLEELAGAGAQIVLCGQTAAHRGIDRGELAKPVRLALSAMTAHVVLQDQGYQLVR